jgi:hypothetical protein
MSGCNRYELFRVSGFAQESFSNDAEILFVIDNSPSMQDEAEALALNFDAFITQLTDPGEGGNSRDGLGDAVDNYISYVTQRGAFLDYQIGITTTDVEGTYGDLYGTDPVLTIGDPNVADGFRENLMCTATCFNELDLASDPAYECGDDLDGQITRQYLDCVCGVNVWEDNCGSGQEEGLEAVFMAMCRGAETPPEECYEQNQFTAADELSNAALFRETSTLIPILVTDEGDTSRRMAQGDGDPDEYDDLFKKFNRRMAWAVIGPNTTACNTGGATTWGVARYQWFVDDTGGRFFDIAEKDGSGDCNVTDFASALEELGQLLNNLLEAFPLASIPDVESILVFIDNEPVDRSEELVDDDTGEVTHGDGWSYLPEENAVEFHGSAVPDYNADVRIYYRPLEGMPKELPW